MINKKQPLVQSSCSIFAYVGWGGKIGTFGMTESESVALPLGDTPKLQMRVYGIAVGWDRWIRTIGMTESKSVALPHGYIPVSILNATRLLYQYFASNASAAALCLQKIHNYLFATIKKFWKSFEKC